MRETTNKKDREKRTGRRGGRGPFPPRNTMTRKERSGRDFPYPVKIWWDRKKEMAEGIASLHRTIRQCRKHEEQVVESIATLTINV